MGKIGLEQWKNHLISSLKHNYFPHKVPLSFVDGIEMTITTKECEILPKSSVDLLSNQE